MARLAGAQRVRRCDRTGRLDSVLLITGTYVGLSRFDIAAATVLYVAIPSLWIMPATARKLASESSPGLLARTRTYAHAHINWLDVVLVLLIAGLLYLALLGALMPEVQFDARWYHLGSAAHYVEVGHFYNIVAATHDPAMGLNPYQEIAYTGFYALSGSHGAKVFAFWDAPLICAAMVAFARAHLNSTRVRAYRRAGVPLRAYRLVVGIDRKQRSADRALHPPGGACPPKLAQGPGAALGVCLPRYCDGRLRVRYQAVRALHARTLPPPCHHHCCGTARTSGFPAASDDSPSWVASSSLFARRGGSG